MGTYDIRNSRFKVLKDEKIVGIILIIKLESLSRNKVSHTTFGGY